MSLLDDALKAVGAAPGLQPGVAPGSRLAPGHGTLEASVDLAGAKVAYTHQVSQSWALSGWGDASWDGNRSAGFAVKGTW